MTESVVLRRKAFRLPRHPASVGEARHRTGGHLASWGHPPRSAIREETVLLVSELAADTVLHGPRDEPDFEVAVTVLAHGSCLVEVSDGIPDEAVLGPAGRAAAPGGGGRRPPAARGGPGPGGG
ncbi:ATP-binding protein, partial [Streptomyces albidoflavus]